MDLQRQIEKAYFNTIKEQEQWLEFMLREKVEPPIKGEITKGKIRNRGLALNHYPFIDSVDIYSMPIRQEFISLEQRGKAIMWSQKEYDEWLKKQK